MYVPGGKAVLLPMLLHSGVGSEKEEEIQQCSATELAPCPIFFPLPFPLT